MVQDSHRCIQTKAQVILSLIHFCHLTLLFTLQVDVSFLCPSSVQYTNVSHSLALDGHCIILFFSGIVYILYKLKCFNVCKL